ncbi:MAG TPA: 6-phosphofructokinase [Phycisphaerae bacterium]|nr:6-phosphofructokinase [Phycisphaerae bacterium]
MSNTTKGNAVVCQSGGPTVVINQSLVGVIEKIKSLKDVDTLLGSKHAVRGIIEENFITLNDIDPKQLEAIALTPAAALGSSRDKPDEAYCEKIFKVFEKHNVRYFFYIGGNDSADTARIVSEMAVEANFDLTVYHIPKTIDNDLRVTDHTPGYGSAAKFVASAFMGDDRDCASLPGIKINIVMGRNAGWLTAASVLGRQDETDGPHLVYVPEVAFSSSDFLEDVKRVYDKLGRCQIAVSEGIVDATGTPVMVSLAERLGHRVERDSHGNVSLSGSGALGDFLSDFLKAELKENFETLRVRADTFGYLQRSFPGFASEVDQKEARMAGRKAVEFAASGQKSGSVAFKRLDKKEYEIEYIRAELKDVARHTKDLPRNFINKEGNNITQAFVDYAKDLVGELPVIGKF